MYRRKRARFLRAPLRALSSPPHSRLRGPRESGALLRAEARLWLRCWLSGTRVERRRTVGTAAQRARAWMRASSAKAQGCASPNPGGPTRTPRSGARSSGVLSLGYFSLDKQREVTRPPPRGTKPRDSAIEGE